MEQTLPDIDDIYTSRRDGGEFQVLEIVHMEQKVNAYTYEWVPAIRFIKRGQRPQVVYVTTIRRFLSQFEFVRRL